MPLGVKTLKGAQRTQSHTDTRQGKSPTDLLC